MNKILQLKARDKKTNGIKNVGSIEIKNQTTDTADIYFYGDIVSESWLSEWYEDDMCPKDIAKLLGELEGINTINIHINSGGGSVFAGLAIGHQLKQYPATIVGYCDGIAASIAGVLLMFCDRIIVPKNAMFMMHKPLCSCNGNADEMRKMADKLDQCQKLILGVYMERVAEGVVEDTISNLINKETWLTGEEMQQYFKVDLADELQMAACESEYFDKYSNLPEDLKAQQEVSTIDSESIANMVASKIANLLENNLSVPTGKQMSKTEELEKIKADILGDLDII